MSEAPLSLVSDRGPFVRHPDNPILTSADLPYTANTVFNSAAVQLQNETLMLLRVEDRRGFSHLTVARSADGVGAWKIDTQPTMMPSPVEHPEEQWGIEDPRIVELSGEGRYAVTYTGYSPAGPLVSLALTDDFERFERVGAVLPPDNKDAALFPVRIDGRYAMLHRPMSGMCNGGDIWIAYSPDLRHWGDHKVLLQARSGPWWDAGKIGLSPPPVRTDKGWLMMYHGVRNTCAGSLYRLGLALLDLDDPCRVIRRSNEWIFGPSRSYELHGDVGYVTFPCGLLLVNGELRMYYGAADTSMALATAPLAEVLQWLDDHSG